jgi:indole-3-glycerol phosphate synthase
MANILTEIIEYKKQTEIPSQSTSETLAELEQRVGMQSPPLDFEAALRKAGSDAKNKKVALIAEVKKASPSKGLLCPAFDPAQLAQAYLAGGAAVLSVLTDQKFFMGDLPYIKLCKEATDNQLPVLRKDFIVDRYQVVQARAYGADAILLIMACLDDTLAQDLFWLATKLKMAVLVEVHDATELKRALQLGARIIGVNNRDLTSFKVDLNTTYQLAELLPTDFDGILVSESGISTNAEIESLSAAGVGAVLIGETLVRTASTETGLDSQRVVQKIQELLNNL